MEDQRRFLEKVSKKQDDLKAQVSNDKESTLRPNIDETSRKIIEEKMGERKNKPTYERLYEMNKEKMQKQNERVMQ